MNIATYTVEQIEDPTGILSGERYEFFIEFEADEEDELFSIPGLKLRILFLADETASRVLNYHFQDSKGEMLDFALEEDEEQFVLSFCKENYQEETEE